jgi:hypothetical protein
MKLISHVSVFLFFRAYCDRARLHITKHIIWAALIDCMLSYLTCHVKLSLLRATTTSSQLVPPHWQKVETDLHKYLLTLEGFKDWKQLVLHVVPPTLHTACIQMGMDVRHRWCLVENVLLVILFMLLSNRETRLLICPTSLTQSGTDPHKYLLT